MTRAAQLEQRLADAHARIAELEGELFDWQVRALHADLRARSEERERAAQIADRCDDGGEGWAGQVEREMQHAIREHIASAIRAERGGKDNG